jgi:hypothetical protein
MAPAFYILWHVAVADPSRSAIQQFSTGLLHRQGNGLAGAAGAPAQCPKLLRRINHHQLKRG